MLSIKIKELLNLAEEILNVNFELKQNLEFTDFKRPVY
jgi:hypothetical protein